MQIDGEVVVPGDRWAGFASVNRDALGHQAPKRAIVALWVVAFSIPPLPWRRVVRDLSHGTVGVIVISTAHSVYVFAYVRTC